MYEDLCELCKMFVNVFKVLYFIEFFKMKGNVYLEFGDDKEMCY